MSYPKHGSVFPWAMLAEWLATTRPGPSSFFTARARAVRARASVSMSLILYGAIFVGTMTNGASFLLSRNECGARPTSLGGGLSAAAGGLRWGCESSRSAPLG